MLRIKKCRNDANKGSSRNRSPGGRLPRNRRISATNQADKRNYEGQVLASGFLSLLTQYNVSFYFNTMCALCFCHLHNPVSPLWNYIVICG